jgi:ech hydrogenase subunit C
MSRFAKSPWIIHYDASSCNGCDIEVLACLTPKFDVERLGVVNTGNPKHADIFLVTGAVNEQSTAVVRNIYKQLPEPKVVVAVGVCASTGGIFRECYNISGGVDCVVPVDVYVPGCAARPEAIIDGVVQALGVLEKKQAEMVALTDGLGKSRYVRAEKADAPEILALQKTAYQSEAAIYSNDTLPALQQTLEELHSEFDRPGQVFLKTVVNGKIIGSMRGYSENGTAHLSRVLVHPYFRNTGIGRQLVHEMEKTFPAAKRFEVRAGHKSINHLERYKALGYQEFKTEPFNASVTWVVLQKERQ